MIIIDEAQRIKNVNSQTSGAVKRIAADAGCSKRLALSGTPIENRLLELYSIFDFIFPGIVPSRMHNLSLIYFFACNHIENQALIRDRWVNLDNK
jgi:SNF2 family DNA or RNA helicase